MSYACEYTLSADIDEFIVIPNLDCYGLHSLYRNKSIYMWNLYSWIEIRFTLLFISERRNDFGSDVGAAAASLLPVSDNLTYNVVLFYIYISYLPQIYFTRRIFCTTSKYSRYTYINIVLNKGSVKQYQESNLEMGERST